VSDGDRTHDHWSHNPAAIAFSSSYKESFQRKMALLAIDHCRFWRGFDGV